MEDTAATIPWLTETNVVNKTILRCSDNILRIKFAGIAGDSKGMALKLQRAVNQAMILRNTLPIFSGNIESSYLVNQLTELDLVAQMKSVASSEPNKVTLSPLYPYYKVLHDSARN